MERDRRSTGFAEPSTPNAGETPDHDRESDQGPERSERQFDSVRRGGKTSQEVEGDEDNVDRDNSQHQPENFASYRVTQTEGSVR
jgi:hypothetical protein